MILLLVQIQMLIQIAFQILVVVIKHPEYAKGTEKARNFLAGSYYFQTTEIEVYNKE